jgi:hypothetical protein
MILGEAISDSDPSVRARALRAVGELGRVDLLPGMRGGLTDSHQNARFATAWSITLLSPNLDSLGVLRTIAESREGIAIRGASKDSIKYFIIHRGNLSRAIQWLNVSYSSGLTASTVSRPTLSGSFQRDCASDVSHLEVSRYVHLNPVRTRRFDLNKDQSPVYGLTPAALICERMRHMRTHGWSFEFYSGLKTPAPG